MYFHAVNIHSFVGSCGGDSIRVNSQFPNFSTLEYIKRLNFRFQTDNVKQTSIKLFPADYDEKVFLLCHTMYTPHLRPAGLLRFRNFIECLTIRMRWLDKLVTHHVHVIKIIFNNCKWRILINKIHSKYRFYEKYVDIIPEALA